MSQVKLKHSIKTKILESKSLSWSYNFLLLVFGVFRIDSKTLIKNKLISTDNKICASETNNKLMLNLLQLRGKNSSYSTTVSYSISRAIKSLYPSRK